MEVLLGLVNCCVSFVVGVLVTVALQYYVFMKYVRQEPVRDVPKKPANERYCLPKQVLECLRSCDASEPAMPVAANLLLQFLFHELRHSSRVRRWFWRKLDMELDELISKSTTGRLFDKLSLRDLHLGSQFPEIKNVRVQNAQLDETEGHIDTLDISLDLTYSGNFQLAIDANMVLGKRAYLAVKVRHISGRARLRFTRLPYTHWSFSFYEEPLIDLAVESQFQGRQMQSNVTSFISNQIRRAIKRKHTLPNYKIRYKPFFARVDPGILEADENSNIEGLLEVTTLEITRLAVNNPNIEQVYYTMCIDSIPWISLTQKDDQVRIVLDTVITKTKTQQLGIVFKQETLDKINASVVIETIVPNSPAYDAKLYRGDTIISIEGKPVTNTNQVAKIVKSVNMSSFNIRVERRLCDTSVHNSTENITVQHFELPKQNSTPAKEVFTKNDVVLETTDSPKSKTRQNSRSVENLTKISFYKSNDSVQIPLSGGFGLRKRNCSVDKTSSDSSAGNTPTGSLTATPLRRQTSSSERSSITENVMLNSGVDLKPAIRCFTSADLPLKSVLPFNNVYTFEMCEGDVYLNINIWGKNRGCDGSVLLGYLNIPLASVINECRDSKLGHYLKCYSLLPPEFLTTNSRSNPMSSHPGYEPCLCYGDILLSFLWSSSEQDKSSTNSISSKKQIFKLSQSSIAPEPVDVPVKDGSKRHDFIRTHFHRATQCDFCGKKIWLKDAVQCRECAMCCHKKCVVKCQAASSCSSNTDSQSTNIPTFRMTEQQFDESIGDEVSRDTSSQDDSLLVEAPVGADGKGYDFSTHRKSFSGLLQASLPASITLAHGQGVKRVNSANNLAIPGGGRDPAAGGSRSLPPSPQHTPRKQSLVSASCSNPFERCPALLEHCDVTDAESVASVVEPLLQHPSQEDLMTIAKDTGRNLYADLPGPERIDKIGAMVSKLRHALDTATSPTNERTNNNSRNSTMNDAERTKQAFLQGKRDARAQALSALMLHYCAAMQHAQEQLDKERERRESEIEAVPAEEAMEQ